MALSTDEARRLAGMSGELHKATGDRMLDDSRLQQLADENGKVPDSAGVAPSGSGYVDTYDLYRAAAAAWREKAGMVAEGYNVKIEGAAFNRSEVYEHYLAMGTKYATMALSLTVDIS